MPSTDPVEAPVTRLTIEGLRLGEHRDDLLDRVKQLEMALVGLTAMLEERGLVEFDAD